MSVQSPSVAANQISQISSLNVANNFSNANQVAIRLTVDNAAGTSDLVPDVFVIGGSGAATAQKDLPQGVTYSGKFESWAAFQQYLRETNCM